MQEVVPVRKRQSRRVRPKNVSLSTSDIEAIEDIRRRYDLDSFAAAVRKAVRLAQWAIEEQEKAA